MSKLFDLEAPIWGWMNEVADIIILSMLWWISCCGIITIGASTTAVFYVLGKKVRKEPHHVFSDFVKSFRENFKQSIPLTIIYDLAAISCISYGTMIINGLLTPEASSSLIYIVPLAIIMLFAFWNYGSYLWAILSRYEMKTKVLCRTAFNMTHRHLISTVVNTLLCGATVWLMIVFPMAIIVAPGLIILAQSYLMQNLFSRYTTTE